jgi:hypothetical protein
MEAYKQTMNHGESAGMPQIAPENCVQSDSNESKRGRGGKRPLLSRHLSRFTYFAILLFCGVSSLKLAIHEGVRLSSLDEGGYGDQYVYHTVETYLKTGKIYTDLRNPFDLPAIYSPLLYVMLSLPTRVHSWENTYFGPRLPVLASFLGCLFLTASISRKLIRHWSAAPVSFLLASSFGVLLDWPIRLRGDFPGIFFALLAVRLLLSLRPWAPALAGASAGFALQFKFTFIAAAVAGFIWLAVRKKWRPLVAFSLGAAVASIGLYSLLLVREPHMLVNIFAIHSTVFQYRGIFSFLSELTREPILLIAIATLPLILIRRWPRWFLLVLYFFIAFTVSAITDLQAGGNINYFFECLFAITPFATHGVFWLRERAASITGVLVGFLVLGLGAGPAAKATAEALMEAKDVAALSGDLRNLRSAMDGLNVFSIVGDASHLAPAVVLSEPFLLSYLERAGKMDSAPWAARIRNQEFDLVVTPGIASKYRGVPFITPKIRAAIAESYQPFCAFHGALLFSRAHEDENSLLQARFTAIGCRPVACPSSDCRTW